MIQQPTINLRVRKSPSTTNANEAAVGCLGLGAIKEHGVESAGAVARLKSIELPLDVSNMVGEWLISTMLVHCWLRQRQRIQSARSWRLDQGPKGPSSFFIDQPSFIENARIAKPAQMLARLHIGQC